MHMDDKLYAVSQSIDLLTYIIVHDGNILPYKQDACYLEEEVQGRHFKAADVSLSKEYFRNQACVATMALVDIVSSPHSLDPLIVFGQLDEEPSKGDSFDRPALVDSDQGSLRGRLVPKKNDRASRTARALGDVFRSAQGYWRGVPNGIKEGVGIKFETVQEYILKALFRLARKSDDSCIQFLQCSPDPDQSDKALDILQTKVKRGSNTDALIERGTLPKILEALLMNAMCVCRYPSCFTASVNPSAS